jgi:hypothetical protein
MPKGIDLPTDVGGKIDAIREANLDFVIRYYRNPTSQWPSLSASEARLLSNAGLTVVAIWEAASAHISYFTHLDGVNDATSAYHQAHGIGQPVGSAIYFAVDFDARDGADTAAVTDYFRGVAAGFVAAAAGDAPAYKVGVYGSGAICAAMIGAGLAEYSWTALSTDWRGTSTYTNWNIKQGPKDPSLPFDHDSDQATNDYGGFRI